MAAFFSHPNPLIVSNACNLLLSAGVACRVHNYYASGASGGLGCQDTWPELWLDRPEDAPLARRLLEGIAEPGRDWFCGECGEENAGAFELCWRCGKVR